MGEVMTSLKEHDDIEIIKEVKVELFCFKHHCNTHNEALQVIFKKFG